MADQDHVGPLVPVNDVDAVGMDHPEVRHRRDGEAEDSGSWDQPRPPARELGRNGSMARRFHILRHW